MFKFKSDYTGLIQLIKVYANSPKQKITYYFAGKVETQTFADSADFDDALAEVEGAGFIQIGEYLYNPARLSTVKKNGKNVDWTFQGNVLVAHEYASESDADAAVAAVEDSFVEIDGILYNGSQIVVANADKPALTIVYDFGGELISAVYADEAAFDDAVAKLADIGSGGGGGQKKVSTPHFSPSAGNIEKGASVTITCGTSGAAIHYTTDGTTPTSASPTYSSPIAVNADVTIKAIAVKAEMTDSSVASASYVVVLPKVATPTFAPAAGEVLSGTEVAISCATTGATIYYTTDGSTPTTASTEYTSAIEVTAAVTIKAIAVKEDMTDSAVATAAYTIGIPTAAAPTFTPNGGEVAKGSTVVLATTTPGGVIHYTTNGSNPTASSPAYTDPIVINANTTIKALTIADGYKNSSVVSKSFTVPAVVLYKYAGVFNNPDEDTDIEPVASDITLEWLEALTDKKKLAATSKEYGSIGNEQVFDGISEDNGGRVIYSYPASLGNLTSYIQNGVTQAIGNSFDKLVSTVDGEEYYTYVLRNSNASPTLTCAFV